MTERNSEGGAGEHPLFAEHRTLHARIAAMRAATTRDELLEQVRGFLGAIQKHFASEESDGGFFASVMRIAPRHQNLVAELRDEHVSLMRDTIDLIESLTRDEGGSFAELRAASDAICDTLGRHEARENEVLLEVMNTDLGTGE